MYAQLTPSYLTEVQTVFAAFDTDGNGALSRTEIAQVLQSLGMNPSEEAITSIFRHTDSDASGTIEFTEFAEWLFAKIDAPTQDDLQGIFHLIDLDNDGTISTDELRKLLATLPTAGGDTDVEALLQQADTSGNGLIEYDEFAESRGLWRQIKLTLGATRSFYRQAEFDTLANEYNELIRLWDPWYDETLQMTVDNLPGEPAAPQILELGSGTGNLIAALLERYPHATVHVVDNAPKMIAYCQNRFDNDERVRLYEQDFMRTNFPEATFDHVVSKLSLHHLANEARKQLFQHVYQWLKPGGVFSYNDIFRGINDHINGSYYADWQKASTARGATDAQWDHFMDHDQRYDVLDMPLPSIIDWLREIGYVDIDITWRHLLMTNLVARKP